MTACPYCDAPGGCGCAARRVELDKIRKAPAGDRLNELLGRSGSSGRVQLTRREVRGLDMLVRGTARRRAESADTARERDRAWEKRNAGREMMPFLRENTERHIRNESAAAGLPDQDVDEMIEANAEPENSVGTRARIWEKLRGWRWWLK